MEKSTWKIYPHVLKNCRCFGRDFYRRVFGWWHFLRYQSNNEKQCFRNVTKKGSMSPATSTFIKNPLKKLPEALEAKLQPHDGSLTHLLQAIKLEGLHLWFVFFGGNRGPRFSSFSTGQPHWGNPTPPEVIETIFWLVNYLVKLVRWRFFKRHFTWGVWSCFREGYSFK